MASYDGHNDLLGQGEVTKDLGHKCRRADNIESCHTKEPGTDLNARIALEILTTYRLGSYTPCFLKTSATMGTVELTGLEMTSTNALGEVVAIPVAKSLTIPPLTYGAS